MKLMVQIPCYNEEENIEKILASVPKVIKNTNEIEIVVLDDGSTDKTAELAQKFNITIIKSNHIGLAGIFNLN